MPRREREERKTNPSTYDVVINVINVYVGRSTIVVLVLLVGGAGTTAYKVGGIGVWLLYRV